MISGIKFIHLDAGLIIKFLPFALAFLPNNHISERDTILCSIYIQFNIGIRALSGNITYC